MEKTKIMVHVYTEEPWFLVSFMCWGQSSSTVFFSLEEAKRWCITVYGQNLGRPYQIVDDKGKLLMDEEGLQTLCKENT